MCSILRSGASVRAGRPGRSTPFPGLREGMGCTDSCLSSFLLFFSYFGFNVFTLVRNDQCSVVPRARETVPSHLVPGLVTSAVLLAPQISSIVCGSMLQLQRHHTEPSYSILTD